jgi:OFA family oxalate/formate antiporter-like MFS transporter
VPVASVLSATGGWNAVFVAAAVITIAAGISAKLILAPMRHRLIESADEPSVPTATLSASSRLSQTGE